MLESYSGATRIYPVVGDPIAQVKSPFGVTQAFEARGSDAICIPMQVAPEDFSAFMKLMSRTKNCDGIIVTVPHKFAAYDYCDTVSDRARFLRSVNTIRRAKDGRFHGDMFDGVGFVAACRENGANFSGKSALLVGCGGAGTAIAHAVADAGVSELALADADIIRRRDLAVRLKQTGFRVHEAGNDPAAFDLVLNATPLGMRDGDGLPFDVTRIAVGAFVGDVVTKPEVPPLIVAARARGLRTSTGVDMFGKVRDLMIDFLLANTAGR